MMNALNSKYISVFPIIFFAFFLTMGCSSSRETANTAASGTDMKVSSTVSGDTAGHAEFNRLVPNPIDSEIPGVYKNAVKRGTRTAAGAPGPNYWQQRSDYALNVELLPDEKKVKGSGTITYHNNSPDTLQSLFLELAQNVHSQGVVRNERAEITGGMDISGVAVNGNSLGRLSRNNRTGYGINGTLMAINLPDPLNPGSTTTIDISWSFEVPQEGAGGRMGYNSNNLFFIAYFYPKVQVYDDVYGWFTEPFRINAEFYHEFGDYNLNITVPEEWIVTSTGEPENAGSILEPTIFERLQKAHSSTEIINVVDSTDFGSVTVPAENGKHTWKFHAQNVRDVAFSATKESIWDATRTPVGDLDGDGQTDYTNIDALYRSSAPLWQNAAKFAQHSIKFLSEYTGLSYPWPHMTAVEGGGIIGGGMEFPMMTLTGAYNGRPERSLYSVIAHELAHMWVPMMISTNERRYSWMDEGTTTFNENQAKKEYYPGWNADISDFQSYLSIAGSDLEGPIMRWSDFHYYGYAYSIASYPKPASILVTLRGLLGKETFTKAYHTFLERWEYKHPYPWDLFKTFEDVTGRDLDWFWRSWYYETWILDHAVESVTSTNNGTRIVIEDRGQAPMPVHIEVTFADGSTTNRTIDVETWLSGKTTASVLINNDKEVTGVSIDPEMLFPDANRTNNTWER